MRRWPAARAWWRAPSFSHELTGAASPIAVKVRGGETLEIAFRQEGKVYRDVTLTGPADFVFDGQTVL